MNNVCDRMRVQTVLNRVADCEPSNISLRIHIECCVAESDHLALVSARDGEVLSKEVGNFND